MSEVALALTLIASLSVAIYLALRSGERYGHHDALAHSTEYAGVVREGHGPLTLFLYVLFACVVLFTLLYGIRHAHALRTMGADQASAATVVH